MTILLMYISLNFSICKNIIKFLYKHFKVTLTVITLILVYYVAMRITGNITSQCKISEAFSSRAEDVAKLANDVTTFNVLGIFSPGVKILKRISNASLMEYMWYDLLNYKIGNAEFSKAVTIILIIVLMILVVIIPLASLLCCALVWICIFGIVPVSIALVIDLVLLLMAKLKKKKNKSDKDIIVLKEMELK